MWHIYVRDGERFVYHSSEDGKSARIVRNGFLARARPAPGRDAPRMCG
jgi:hypothetical protein